MKIEKFDHNKSLIILQIFFSVLALGYFSSCSYTAAPGTSINSGQKQCSYLLIAPQLGNTDCYDYVSGRQACADACASNSECPEPEEDQVFSLNTGGQFGISPSIVCDVKAVPKGFDMCSTSTPDIIKP